MRHNPTRLQEPVTAPQTPRTLQKKSRRSTFARAVAPIIVGVAIGLAPAPHGLPLNAWRYFALFAAVLVGMITELIPPAALGLVGVIVAAAAGLVRTSSAQSTVWALSGFGNATVWLIFAAFIFSLGYAKTGFGKRIALLLIRTMGRRTLGLGYAIALGDLALAPFMPSNTARSGGTIFPILRNIPELYGSWPNDESSRKIGAYLMYTALAATCVTSSMFLTAIAPNVLAADLALRTVNVTLSWMDWFRGFAPIGFLLFALVPILLYKIYPPEIREAPEAPRWAADELRKMGPISAKEMILLVLVLLALALWTAGAKYVDATMAAMIVVILMLVLRVINWNDILGYTEAWNVFVWFATLVALAGGLVDTKFVDWVARSFAPIVSHRGVTMAAVLLVAAFFLLHYLFASLTAHVSALFQVFLVVAVTIPGMSRLSWALLLSYPLGLMGILTPYGTGPSPIYYGCGYVKGKDFWLLGFFLGVIFFAVYLLIELPWLAFLKI
jgi:L-tartrate/succinate antiporter